MAWSKGRQERAAEAANWFISGAAKRTVKQIAKQFGLSLRQAFQLIQDIREVTHDSPYNLTAAQPGARKPWVFWMTAVSEEDGFARRFDLKYQLTRLRTRWNMSSSFVLAAKGNTREGKVARAIKAHVEAAIAELELVD